MFGLLYLGDLKMNTKIICLAAAMTIFGQSVTAQGSTWRTFYNAPISTFETNKWNAKSVSVTVQPGTKVVWFGGGSGSALTKVTSLVEAATKLGSQKLRGRRDVNLNVVILTFKSPTPNVRRSNRTDLGVHHINFSLEVVDAKSGRLLLPPTVIEADLEALTGDFAKAFEAQRQGQRERTTQHLASVVQGFLGQGPDPRRRFTRYAK